MASRPKKLTPAKVDRARDALDAILECDDLSRWFPDARDLAAFIDAKDRLKVGVFGKAFQ